MLSTTTRRLLCMHPRNRGNCTTNNVVIVNKFVQLCSLPASVCRCGCAYPFLCIPPIISGSKHQQCMLQCPLAIGKYHVASLHDQLESCRIQTLSSTSCKCTCVCNHNMQDYNTCRPAHVTLAYNRST